MVIHRRRLFGARVEERRRRVATLVAAAGRGRSDVRRNRLRRDFDPLAAQVVVPILWELQLPQRGVDAHVTFVTSHPGQDERKIA